MYDLLSKLTVNTCTNTLHMGNCCDKAYAQPNEAPAWTNIGIIAYFVPHVEDNTPGKAEPMHPVRYRKWTNGIEDEPTVCYTFTRPPSRHGDLSQEQWVEPKTKRPISTAGYTVEMVDAADPEEVRVQQMVRDFGFLPSDRAIKYATSIGMDWDGFGVEVVGVEDEYEVVPIENLPMGVGRERRDLNDIRGWRERRGMYRDAIPHATADAWLKS